VFPDQPAAIRLHAQAKPGAWTVLFFDFDGDVRVWQNRYGSVAAINR
jgi:hypothetical protein